MFSKVLQAKGCNHSLISNVIDIAGFLPLEISFMQNGRERKKNFFLIEMAGKESSSYSNGKIS